MLYRDVVRGTWFIPVQADPTSSERIEGQSTVDIWRRNDSGAVCHTLGSLGETKRESVVGYGTIGNEMDHQDRKKDIARRFEEGDVRVDNRRRVTRR